MIGKVKSALVLMGAMSFGLFSSLAGGAAVSELDKKISEVGASLKNNKDISLLAGGALAAASGLAVGAKTFTDIIKDDQINVEGNAAQPGNHSDVLSKSNSKHSEISEDKVTSKDFSQGAHADTKEQVHKEEKTLTPRSFASTSDNQEQEDKNQNQSTEDYNLSLATFFGGTFVIAFLSVLSTFICRCISRRQQEKKKVKYLGDSEGDALFKGYKFYGEKVEEVKFLDVLKKIDPGMYNRLIAEASRLSGVSTDIVVKNSNPGAIGKLAEQLAYGSVDEDGTLNKNYFFVKDVFLPAIRTVMKYLQEKKKLITVNFGFFNLSPFRLAPSHIKELLKDSLYDEEVCKYGVWFNCDVLEYDSVMSFINYNHLVDKFRKEKKLGITSLDKGAISFLRGTALQMKLASSVMHEKMASPEVYYTEAWEDKSGKKVVEKIIKITEKNKKEISEKMQKVELKDGKEVYKKELELNVYSKGQLDTFNFFGLLFSDITWFFDMAFESRAFGLLYKNEIKDKSGKRKKEAHKKGVDTLCRAMFDSKSEDIDTVILNLKDQVGKTIKEENFIFLKVWGDVVKTYLKLLQTFSREVRLLGGKDGNCFNQGDCNVTDFILYCLKECRKYINAFYSECKRGAYDNAECFKKSFKRRMLAYRALLYTYVAGLWYQYIEDGEIVLERGDTSFFELFDYAKENREIIFKARSDVERLLGKSYARKGENAAEDTKYLKAIDDMGLCNLAYMKFNDGIAEYTG